MKTRLFTALMCTISLCWADTNQIKQLFHAILSASPDQALPKADEFASILSAVDVMPANEVAALLPIARQCLQSPRQEVRADGLTLLLTVSSRLDSSKLIDPYAQDLGEVLSDPASPLRQMALAILAITISRPGTSPKVAGVLSIHLEDKNNSPQETSGIAASLLGASPSDPALVQKVLRVAEQHSEFHITVGVLRALGLSKTRNQDALSFIGNSLDNSDPQIRETAVEAVSRLDRNNRTRFASQLGHIAGDNNEPQHVRSRAVEALR